MAPGNDGSDEAPLLQRYALLRRLGEGSHGVTWRARDLLTEREVAVKLLHASRHPEHARRLRREIAALRVLRVHGVARLLDQGERDGAPVLVMELVEGSPFPGADVADWSSALRVTARLLETLAHLHGVGVVHGDIKPPNVLVTPTGQPVVLDFGAASGAFRADLEDAGRVTGSLAWVSPEQRLGDPPTPRSDLYSVGVMLARSLTDPRPVALDRWIAALTRHDPDERPASAAEALQWITEDAVLAPHVRSTLPRHAARASEPVTPGVAEEISALAQGPRHASPAFSEERLRALFKGPERILHCPSEAARILYARTRGVPDAIIDELNAWVRAGFAQWDRDQLSVSPFVFDEFVARIHVASTAGAAATFDTRPREGPEPSLDRLLTRRGADGDPEEILRTLLAQTSEAVDALCDAGRYGAAMTLLGEVLGVVRVWAGPVHGAEEALLARLCKIALQVITQRALDLANYELKRARSPRTGWLADLVQAALSARTHGERALALAEAIPASSDLEFEAWRHIVRMRAARRCSTEREASVLRDVRAWAAAHDTPFARAVAADLESRHLYRVGRYRDAAERAEAAVREESGVVLLLGAMINTSGAWLETFELDRARRWAERARTLAAERHQASFEAHAEALLRRIDYHAGRALAPDHELVRAVSVIGEYDLHNSVLIVEAAFAWRCGELRTAREFAALALESSLHSGLHDYAMLARVLGLAAGAPCSRDDLEALAAQGLRCTTRGMGLQVLGLLAPHVGEVPDAWREAALRDAARVPREAWAIRMDLTSVEEALKALRLTA